jgi:hypothetical protein
MAACKLGGGQCNRGSPAASLASRLLKLTQITNPPGRLIRFIHKYREVRREREGRREGWMDGGREGVGDEASLDHASEGPFIVAESAENPQKPLQRWGRGKGVSGKGWRVSLLCREGRAGVENERSSKASEAGARGRKWGCALSVWVSLVSRNLLA